ncbi:glycoside hydrolase family 71 protein [Rhodococcus sp. ARC_M6]|uniref:glycoside hydrolase family 71 protein n=1 Tax=Rhodococcus sp. ARC_M6 TaxID=2928852 RepID=UPI001FB4AE71|nr:glycoside hydrolase family 71 protein [Rhodococcus sp. ARC_M6]MCJ0904086.1 glycoside hydrolase family 71 protein [Rhodococcus sp. ARC_M6]
MVRFISSGVRVFTALVAVAVLVAINLTGSFEDPGKIDRIAMMSESDTNFLPFDAPSQASVNSKRVFAHYFPPYPISLDNENSNSDIYSREYLSADGEGGVHSTYGGFLRDRPLPRATITDPEWRMRDLENEVLQATSAGINGFSVDIMARSNDSSWWGSGVPLALMQAAINVNPNFKVMLMPDMSADFQSMTPAELAAEMSVYVDLASTYRLDDGRLVISPFGADLMSPSWWSQFLNIMQSTYGETVAFVPLFLDAASNIDAFASISYGMSNWGERNPNANSLLRTDSNAPLVLAKRVHDLGKIWMQPVSFQDARPRQEIFDETINTLNLRNTWDIAMESDSEWVQLVTWNDYSEGTSFAPSVEHGYALLDLNSFMIATFRLGVRPQIVRDTLFVTYRNQPTWSNPVNPSSAPMEIRDYSPAADNTVEVLTFLTEPADLTIKVGETTTTCHVAAGVYPCVAGLGAGNINVVATRGGVEVARVDSHVTVTETPYNQNFDYLMDSSGR